MKPLDRFPAVALLVMTDGRDTIGPTIASAEANLIGGPITEQWIHDDTGDPAHADELRRRFPNYQVITTAGRSGFGGAIRSAWSVLREVSEAPYIFHLEDDFTFNRRVHLGMMARVLLDRPYLVNLALRRQPWNEAEIAAGGIVEQHPGDFIEQCAYFPFQEHWWLEHRRFFTTNPSLYRRELIHSEAWPEGPNSEGRFTHQLLADPATRFGYWGARDSGEWVHHIGHQRVGTGY